MLAWRGFFHAFDKATTWPRPARRVRRDALCPTPAFSVASGAPCCGHERSGCGISGD
jgi:hypothetical protein